MFSQQWIFQDFNQFADDLNNADEMMYRHMSRGFFTAGDSYIQFHKRARLRGRPGLNTVSRQGLSRSAHTEVGGKDLDSLTGITFFSGSVVKYVKVHEYQTVIVPVKAKALRFEVDGQVIFAKSVTTVPRLKWFDGWERYEPHRNEILDNATDAALEELAQ